ncbi:MAG: calcium-binding protein, partial [Planctomycetota bacterium]
RLSGGTQQDFYFYALGQDDIFINEFESNLGAGDPENRFDVLNLFVDAVTDDVTAESFSLDLITDAFFVQAGETAESVFNSPDNTTTNAFLRTRTGGVEIFEQYGGDDSSDTADGIERIDYRFDTRNGSPSNASFRVGNEDEALARNNTGDGNSEFFIGTREDDFFSGAGGADLIFTGDGRDTAFGGSSADHLHGSRGTNLLYGGGSGDFYYWNRAFTATNRIEDDNNGSGDVLQADFDVWALSRAVADPDGTDQSLELAYANPNTPTRDMSSFEILEQFTGSLNADGIEHARFNGVWYDLQSEFSTTGTSENDLIVEAQTGGRSVDGGGGMDALFGNGGADRQRGQGGDDFLDGGGGKDRLFGGNDDDMLRGGAGADVMNGGSGKDTADYRFSEKAVTVDLDKGTGKGGDANGDKLKKIENVKGSANADKIYGNKGENDLKGENGNDLIRGRNGDDMIFGNGNADRVYGDAGKDKVYGGRGADKVWGNDGNDAVWGDAGNDTVYGQDGRDKVYGGAGKDVVIGGDGNDVLVGGGGRDMFRVGVGTGRDTIRDWQVDIDKIQFAKGGPERLADLEIFDRGSTTFIKWNGGSLKVLNADESFFDNSAFDFA